MYSNHCSLDSGVISEERFNFDFSAKTGLRFLMIVESRSRLSTRFCRDVGGFAECSTTATAMLLSSTTLFFLAGPSYQTMLFSLISLLFPFICKRFPIFVADLSFLQQQYTAQQIDNTTRVPTMAGITAFSKRSTILGDELSFESMCPPASVLFAEDWGLLVVITGAFVVARAADFVVVVASQVDFVVVVEAVGPVVEGVVVKGSFAPESPQTHVSVAISVGDKQCSLDPA